MLQAGQHVVVVSFHAAQFKGFAVECIIQLQHTGSAVRLAHIRFQHTVCLNVAAVFFLLPGCHTAAQPVQDLFFQCIAGKLLHLHQLQVDGCHMGAALRFDVHHAGQIEHQQSLPHGRAADAQLFGQLPVIQRITGLQLHRDDPAADRLVCRFARTQ